MKIVLISNTYSPSPILLVIHEMIKERGYESHYVHIPVYKSDFPEEFYDGIDNKIRKVYEGADLIAFTCMTNTFLACTKFIQRIRKNSNAPIAIGGIHSTAKPIECVKYADYACVGEGENAFMELIDRLAKNKDPEHTQGFYARKGKGIIKNQQGSLVKDLDSLPVPSFNLKNQYFIFNNKLICMEDYKNDQEMLRQYFTKYYFMVTSRGCPYTCKFCINDVLKRLSPEYRIIRKRGNDHIFKELKNMKNVLKYPLTIGFADDDFFSQSVEQMKDFSERYKKEIGNIPFFCSSTPHSMHEDKMRYAVEAGLCRLEIGIQSINDKTNWEIHGRAGLKKDVVRAISIASPYRHKIQINYDLILDNPWEPEESVLETLRFMFEIPKPCTFAIFSLVPFPGTSQYERAKAEGLLQDQEKFIYNNDIMLLKNNQLNTLITLYGKYHIPIPIIKAGILVRNVRPFSTLLRKSTVPLWRFYAYYEGFKMSIKDKNYVAIKLYMRAPFNKAYKVIKSKLIPKKEKNKIVLTTETLIENKAEMLSNAENKTVEAKTTSPIKLNVLSNS